MGFPCHGEATGDQLTCFLRHGPKPRYEPQQDSREAHLEAEQLLSLSPPSFTPPSVQHHSRFPSSGHGRVWHPVYHHAGHGALVRPSRPAGPPVVVQRFERERGASGETSLVGASAPGPKSGLIRSPWMKTREVTSPTSGEESQNKARRHHPGVLKPFLVSYSYFFLKKQHLFK